MEIKDIRRENFSLLYQQLGLKKAEFCAKCGIQPAQFSQFVNGADAGGRDIGERIARRIEEANSLAIGWMDTDQSQPKENGAVDLEDTNKFHPIKRVSYKASAGITGYSVTSADGALPPIYFPTSFYEKRRLDPDSLETIRVSGDSMEPSLYDEDWVILNKKSRRPKDEVVFVLNYEGEIVIKRLVKLGSEWLATSDNKRYRDKPMTENCKIIGEVIHKQSERI